MAKVTEQDLIDRGFKRKWFDDKSGYWYEKRFKHPILKNVYLHTDHNGGINISINKWYPEFTTKTLTHANLDLFIRFAEGKEL